MNTFTLSYYCSPDAFVTQRSDSLHPPIKVDFFLSPKNCQLLARIEVKNMFSLFDLASVGDEADADKPPEPFLNIDAVVIDESNFSTTFHRRFLRLTVKHPIEDRGIRSPQSTTKASSAL